MQLEVCSDVSRIPPDVYHRAEAARDCKLHSLCVLPMWIPAVSQKAPIAVLELLQPEPQPDFELLCEQVRSRRYSKTDTVACGQHPCMLATTNYAAMSVAAVSLYSL